MPEHIEPRPAPPVVELPLGKDAEQRRLSDVEAAEDGDPEIDVLLIIRHLKRAIILKTIW